MSRRRSLAGFTKGVRVKYKDAHLRHEGTVYLDAPHPHGDEYCIVDWDQRCDTSLEWKPNLKILKYDKRLQK